MSWWGALTGLFGPVKELVEVFTPNAEKGAERGHLERMALTRQDMASLQQFAGEFHAREGRTKWDSFIDGLNRLPRPLITLGILAFFVLAPADPATFLQIARAYQVMPDGFWALLGVIVAFYFGGRMQLKRQDMAVKGDALTLARRLIEEQRAAAAKAEAERREAEPSPTAQVPVETPAAPVGETRTMVVAGRRSNRVVQAWREHVASAG